MRPGSNLLNAIRQIWKRADLFSLQFRLTAGVVAFSTLGLSGVALWTSWRMQQILIDSHKQTVQDIAERFPQDLEIYSKMMPVGAGLQSVINNRATPSLFLWVTRPDGTILAQSTSLQQNQTIAAALLSLSGQLSQPQVEQANGHYFVLCGGPLRVQGAMGRLHVAQDITRDQTMFITLVHSLSIATILSSLLMMGVIAVYVGQSLQPLRQMNQLAGTVSPDNLGQARLRLGQSPSEVKELSQTFNMMLSRLSSAWEQQRQFVSDVSHELRTPLTLVQGYLQSLLRRSTNLTEPQQEALEVASSEAERTIHLLQDLLDLARADSGYLYFQLESFVLNDLVAEVVGMADQFSNNPILIEADRSPITILSDPNRLRQVLINLLDNAMKYSASGTPITLSMEQMAETAIIQVRDHGYGIPLQQQARIFERFYRIDEVRARSTGGSGLGLAIVKTLVEGLGGSVTVRSKLGEGSIFTVSIPSGSTNP